MSRFAVLSIGAMLVFGGASAAQAKTIGRYSATIEIENANDFAQAFRLLSGWSCSDSTRVSYSEQVADHRGRPKQIERVATGTWNWESAFGQRPVFLSFERDFYALNPTVDVSLTTNCSRSQYNPCQYSETNSQTGISQCVGGWDTINAYFGWRCVFTQLPTNERADIVSSCTPFRSGLFGGGFDAWMLSSMNRKNVASRIRFHGTREEILHSNCTDSDPEAYLLNFSQGIGGRNGEDDFVFVIRIDGQELTVASTSGLLSADVLYCPKTQGQQAARIEVEAREKDLVFDDVYRVSPFQIRLADQTVSEVNFRRRSYSLGLFTPRKSTMKVTVRKLR